MCSLYFIWPVENDSISDITYLPETHFWRTSLPSFMRVTDPGRFALLLLFYSWIFMKLFKATPGPCTHWWFQVEYIKYTPQAHVYQFSLWQLLKETKWQKVKHHTSFYFVSIWAALQKCLYKRETNIVHSGHLVSTCLIMVNQIYTDLFHH